MGTDTLHDGSTGDFGSDETRPKTSYLLPCIKAFDVAVNTAQVDMQALAAQVSAINGNKVDRSEWTQSLGESGWQRLPSGLILQWGAVSITTEGVAQEVLFPTSFTSACASITAVLGVDYGGAGNDAVSVYNASVSKFTVRAQYGASPVPVNWIAVGY